MMKTESVNPISAYSELMEYLMDAGQRTVLYWDVMRQRGNRPPTCSSSTTS
jgi:hypothetical protein